MNDEYRSATTNRLLMLLVSRDERKRWHDQLYRWSDSNSFSDSDDERIQEAAASELEDRIDRDRSAP